MTSDEQAKAEIMRLFTAHQLQLRAYAYSICRDAHLTEDIVQNVAVVLMTKGLEYDTSRPFLPWVMGITRRKALEMCRQRGKSVLVSDESLLDRMENSLIETAGTDYVEARLDAMLACVELVGKEGREVLNMKYVRKMSVREIADVTRRNVAAINSLLQRLRAKVVECVDRRMTEAAQ
jgi:RNA polymerase sigma-70 factor (ECF subfamily)